MSVASLGADSGLVLQLRDRAASSSRTPPAGSPSSTSAAASSDQQAPRPKLARRLSRHLQRPRSERRIGGLTNRPSSSRPTPGFGSTKPLVKEVQDVIRSRHGLELGQGAGHTEGREMRKRFGRTVFAISAVGAVAFAGAVTYALADTGGGVINACYKKANGQLRIGTSCNPSEQAVSEQSGGRAEGSRPHSTPSPSRARGGAGARALGHKGPRGGPGQLGRQGRLARRALPGHRGRRGRRGRLGRLGPRATPAPRAPQGPRATPVAGRRVTQRADRGPQARKAPPAPGSRATQVPQGPAGAGLPAYAAYIQGTFETGVSEAWKSTDGPQPEAGFPQPTRTATSSSASQPASDAPS